MSEESKIASALNAAKGVIDSVPVYPHAIQPAAVEFGEAAKPAGREIGEAITLLAKTFHTAVKPLKGLIWSWERIEEFVTNRVEEEFKNKPDRLIIPNVTVAVPAIEALRIAASEPTLRELYMKLLLTAMDRDTAEIAHPAFANIIAEITPDEARIIKLVSDSGGNIPLSGNASEYPNRVKQMIVIPAKCDQGELIETYLDNLDRLKILRNLRFGDNAGGINYNCSLTSLGKTFCAACISNEN